MQLITLTRVKLALIVCFGLSCYSLAIAGLGARTDFKTSVTGGIVVSNDTFFITITELGTNELKKFTAGDVTDVHVNGRDTSLDDVKVGMRVKIVHYSNGEIKSLRAVSGGKRASN
jgi:hypothetical protein